MAYLQILLAYTNLHVDLQQSLDDMIVQFLGNKPTFILGYY
jgi:hypothetical protein